VLSRLGNFLLEGWSKLSTQNGISDAIEGGSNSCHQIWLDQFAGYLEVERNYSSHTIRAYMNDLRQLIGSEVPDTLGVDTAANPQGSTTTTNSTTETTPMGTSSEAPDLTPGSGWLEAEGLRAYIRQIQEQYSRPTVARKISCYRSFLSLLRREQLIDEDPSKQVRGPKLTRRLPSLLRQRRNRAFAYVTQIPIQY
jgi:integrase/recombinase XerC